MLAPLYAEPGICKVNSPYASGKGIGFQKDRVAQGRYSDGNHIRFVAGFPEKLGGWAEATMSLMTDVPRAMMDFRNASGAPLLGIATTSHLYYFDGINLVDITPQRDITTGTLTNPITTTSGSAVVAIADNSQVLVNGDFVFLEASSAVGGLTINGWYPVSSRTGSGYNITTPTAATSNAGPGGGSTTFSYPRVNLTNPYTTTLNSTTVKVTHTAHGALKGDYVDFSGGSPVGGLTLNGEFQITNVIDANNYDITSSTPATSGATGGGTVSVTYDISVGQTLSLTPIAYGQGAFGVGAYGYTVSSTPSQSTGWTLAPYGSDLIAAPIGGTIYLYNSTYGGRAYPLLNAPTSVLAIFVTAERFLFALGINGNPMQIAWPDENDLTDWTSTATNTANSGRSFQGGSFMVAGTPVANGISLFFSNRCTFAATYSGDNLVYDTPLLSDQAGIIGPGAATTLGGVAYWMSDHDFWTWNGTVVPLLSDDIRDYVFQNINTQYQSRSIAGTNRAKKEVWFFYPSAQSTDIDSYVIYHIDQPGVWSIGKLVRTAWRDSDLLSEPFGADTSGILYIHEQTTNNAGAAMDSYITFAPTDISNGNQNMDVFGFIADFERLSGPINLTVTVQQYPQDTPTSIGPFTIQPNDTTPLFDFRCDGKLVGYTLESNVLNGDFRLGLPRANVQPAGARL